MESCKRLSKAAPHSAHVPAAAGLALRGELAPPPNDARSLRASNWHQSDDIACQIGRHLDRIADIDAYETALGRPVPGLYAQLFEGRLYRGLRPERDEMERHKPQLAEDDWGSYHQPDWAIRSLLRTGRLPGIDYPQHRIMHLQKILSRPHYRHLPLAEYVRKESWTLMLNFRQVLDRVLQHLTKVLADNGPERVPLGDVRQLTSEFDGYLRLFADLLPYAPQVRRAWAQLRPQLVQLAQSSTQQTEDAIEQAGDQLFQLQDAVALSYPPGYAHDPTVPKTMPYRLFGRPVQWDYFLNNYDAG